MKEYVWNFFGIVGVVVSGFGGLVAANTFLYRITGSKRAKAEDQQIRDHLKVGAFLVEGDHYGSNDDGLPGRMDFPTLQLVVVIGVDKTVKVKHKGYGWEPVTGRLRDDILYAYGQKVWG